MTAALALRCSLANKDLKVYMQKISIVLALRCLLVNKKCSSEIIVNIEIAQSRNPLAHEMFANYLVGKSK